MSKCRYNLLEDCSSKRDCLLCVLGKISAEIKDLQTDIYDNEYDSEKHDFVFERIYEIIDEHRIEVGEKTIDAIIRQAAKKH